MVLFTYDNEQDGGPITILRCNFTGVKDFALTSVDRTGHVINIEQSYLGGSAIYALNGTSGPGTVWNVKRTVLGPTQPNSWLVFSGDGSGAELNFTNCAFYGDERRSNLMQDGINHVANTYIFIHCTFSETFGIQDRVWIDVSGSTGSTFDFRNCLIAGFDSQNVSLIGGLDASQAVVSAGVNLWSVGSANPSDPVRAQGEVLDGDANLDDDDFHLRLGSAAINRGAPNLTLLDIDNEQRPRVGGFDLGCDESPFGLPEGGNVLPGDCNSDGGLDISDGVCLLAILFLGATEPLPCGTGGIDDRGNITLLDGNGDTSVDLTDAVVLFGYLFLGQAPLAHCTGPAGNPCTCMRIGGCADACR